MHICSFPFLITLTKSMSIYILILHCVQYDILKVQCDSHTALLYTDGQVTEIPAGFSLFDHTAHRGDISSYQTSPPAIIDPWMILKVASSPAVNMNISPATSANPPTPKATAPQISICLPILKSRVYCR